MIKLHFRTFLFILVFGFSFVLYANEVNEEEVKKIANELRCPICQGLSVKESSTVIAENMKTEIRHQLREGKDRSEIYQFFEERYGEWILRTPNKKGFNLLLWILPFVLVGGFLTLLYFKFKQWKKPVENTNKPSLLTLEEEEKFRQLSKSL